MQKGLVGLRMSLIGICVLTLGLILLAFFPDFDWSGYALLSGFSLVVVGFVVAHWK